MARVELLSLVKRGSIWIVFISLPLLSLFFLLIGIRRGIDIVILSLDVVLLGVLFRGVYRNLRLFIGILYRIRFSTAKSRLSFSRSKDLRFRLLS